MSVVVVPPYSPELKSKPVPTPTWPSAFADDVAVKRRADESRDIIAVLVNSLFLIDICPDCWLSCYWYVDMGKGFVAFRRQTPFVAMVNN